MGFYDTMCLFSALNPDAIALDNMSVYCELVYGMLRYFHYNFLNIAGLLYQCNQKKEEKERVRENKDLKLLSSASDHLKIGLLDFTPQCCHAGACTVPL